MKNDIHPLRVLLKAIFLFVILNVIFALSNPPVGKITLYNHIIPGRLRFPYDKDPSSSFVGYSVPVDADYDAMFGEHVISQKKPASEYRLILLGDSATWGFGLPSDETLSEQINRLHIITCDGRIVRAYNLAYPFSYVTRDLLILDKAMEYQPDLVLWLITLTTLVPKVEETEFIAPHWERYLELADTYNFQSSHFSPLIQKPSFWQKTIVGQRKRLKSIALTQLFGILWAGTGIDNRKSFQSEPGLPDSNVEGDLEYEGWLFADRPALIDSLLMDVLSAGFDVAGEVPVVLVNEPIFIANGKNHLVRYNGLYPRWAYDEYRQFMLEWTEAHSYRLLDYWNAFPPKEFYDPIFHLRLSGVKQFAKLLAPEINKLVCP